MSGHDLKKENPTIKKIFQAALDSLAENGYAKATMDDIIKRAGISKGSLYWHFSSKKELFVNLFEYWLEGFGAGYYERFQQVDSWEESFDIFFDMTKMMIANDPRMTKAYLEFMNIILRDEDFAIRMLDIFNSYSQMMKEFIDRGIEQGKFSQTNSLLASNVILGMFDGLMLRAMVDKEFDFDSHLVYAKELIMKALQK